MVREEFAYTLEIFPVIGIPEIKPGDELSIIINDSLEAQKNSLCDGDIVVIAQKIVSKSEGCIHKKENIKVSSFAEKMCSYTGHAPEYMELVLQESRRIVRMANGFVIAQTHHGFVMANAGVDASNSGAPDTMITLPKDPDLSARLIKENLEKISGKQQLAVIISDTFGRPWRTGHVNMAIGVAGMDAVEDYRGLFDSEGREMKVTQIAAADELCSAAELVSGKIKKMPVVIIRNYPFKETCGTASILVRDETMDIFK